MMFRRTALAGLVWGATASAKDLQEFFASQEELVTKSDEAITPEERVAKEVAEETSSVRHSRTVARTVDRKEVASEGTHLKASVDKSADMAEVSRWKIEVPKAETHPKAALDSEADEAEALHVKFAVSSSEPAAAKKPQQVQKKEAEPAKKQMKTSVAPPKKNSSNSGSSLAAPRAEKELLPKLQVVMSNATSFGSVDGLPSNGRGHLLAGAVPKQATHFMAKADLAGPNVVAGDQCSCEFRGLCTCEAAVEFMDCISARCTSGNCDCTELQFQHACVSIASTCSVDPLNGVMGIEMACSPDRATCLVERDSELYQQREPDLIYEELRELKEKKCRLDMHADNGWLNAQRQLGSVKLEIDHRMEELVGQNASLPEMHCEKHFEEWHEEHLVDTPEEGPVRSGAERFTALMLAPLCVAAAFVGTRA